MIEEFIGNGGNSASPIDKQQSDDDGSPTSNLNDTTQLSLPSSFDDSLCLSLYQDLLDRGQHNNVDEKMTHNDNLLESKVRQLLSTNLELQERCRLFDSLKKNSSDLEAENVDLRSQLQHQIALNKENQKQILEYKQKIHLIGIDLEHSRNENELYLSRAEKAEKAHTSCLSELKSTQHKYEQDIARLISEQDALKASCKQKVSQMRDEILSSRAVQNDAFARESKLLLDARDTAVEQTSLLRQELTNLRVDKETKDAETSDYTKELERQLADVRASLKIRSSELNTLSLSHDRLVSEASLSNDENTKIKESLVQMQTECTKLEMSIRQKDEALKIYHHDDLLVDVDPTNSSDDFFSGRRLIVKNSVALARKCRELQGLLKKQDTELSLSREKLETLTRKEESNVRMFKELATQSNKNASTYIISALEQRDEEILKLSSKINTLQTDLNKVGHERDDVTSQLTHLLERREQLSEMKGLLENVKRSTTSATTNIGATTTPQRLLDIDNVEVDDDIFEHMIHRSYTTLQNSNSKKKM